jgi:hypothetical protein
MHGRQHISSEPPIPFSARRTPTSEAKALHWSHSLSDREPVSTVSSVFGRKVASEDDIRGYALEVAREFGDPAPNLIQHASVTRRAATTVLGSIVFADDPVWLIAIRGRFRIRRSRPARPRTEAVNLLDEDEIFLPVLVRIAVQETGMIVDTGAHSTYPDLSALGPVTTDLGTP